LGFNVNDEDIFTCGMATANYLASRKVNGTAYVIGEGGLLTELHNVGYSIVDDNPDYVVIGEGRTIMLESVDKAINMILNGSKLIATNTPDFIIQSVKDLLDEELFSRVLLQRHGQYQYIQESVLAHDPTIFPARDPTTAGYPALIFQNNGA